jgi:ATP-dependent DNA helicase RecG
MLEQDLIPIVNRLRAQRSDDEFVEVKASAKELPSKIWQSVSAFANTSGGLIILGLDEDDGFRPVKHFAIDKVLNQFITGMGDGDPNGARIAQPPSYHPHRYTFEGSPVIAIEVEELETDKKPCYVAGRGIVGGSYKRVDDHDVRLSPSEIYSLQNYLTPSRVDRKNVAAATVDDLMAELVDGLLERQRDSRALMGAQTRQAKMARLNIVDDSGGVRLAGLLTCGSYPQQFYPKLVIDVAAHPGVHKSDPASPMRFLDREICEGPVGEALDAAFRAVRRNLRTYSVVRGTGRYDELEIPDEVIREALANAVVHREYGEYFEGQAVSVDIYPDRLEVTSPGGLWGGKTKENIGDGISVCRNAALMRLMSLMPLPGNSGLPTEGNGSGIPLMKSAMASRALAEPEFVPGIDSFKVILNRGGAEIAENRQWLDRAVEHDLDRHERAVAAILRRTGSATVSLIRDRLGIDSDDIRKAFQGLVDDGVLKWTGTDEVELTRRPRWSREEWSAQILGVLNRERPMGIGEIADVLGRRPENVRQYLQELVKSGNVIATAPVSSTRVKYLLASQDE